MIMATHLFNIGVYAVHSLKELDRSQLLQIQQVLEEPVQPSAQHLSGRARPIFFNLEEVGPVVLKAYLRGGFPGKIISRTYLKLGRPRSGVEMDMLLLARKLGINAPEPVCWVTKGSIVYQTWLVLKEAPGVEPLSLLAGRDEKKALPFMTDVRRQVLILIKHGLYHVDLHPGNVLVGDGGKVFIIDFDKARHFSGSEAALFRRYEKRWRRAVRKYGLPESLCRIMDN